MSEYIEKKEVLKQIDYWLMTGEYKYSNATYYLNKRISNIKPKSEWIQVKDRLPDKDGFYLAYYTFKDGRHARDIFYYNCGSPISSTITHWMPIPELPKGD